MDCFNCSVRFTRFLWERSLPAMTSAPATSIPAVPPPSLASQLP
ncbi:hypothetical protein PDR5_03670 [Pseudomonas sp. DR 5-09]|nr:hypothetical protein PDR5_03670 [Pseudomonas sp. DR 5-09]